MASPKEYCAQCNAEINPLSYLFTYVKKEDKSYPFCSIECRSEYVKNSEKQND